MQHASPHSGFTLMELLIVIAVIGILAGMIFPAVGYVREKAKKDECLNNVRQWGAALQGYLDEHRGIFPTYGSGSAGGTPSVDEVTAWYNVLPVYIGLDPMKSMAKIPHPGLGIKSPLLCPSETGGAFDDDSESAAKTYFSSYSFNALASGIRFSKLTYPASFVVFAETDDGLKSGINPSLLNEHCFRHTRSMNVCFGDGHAENVHMNTMWEEGLAANANHGGLQWNPVDDDLKGSGD